jgi:hypothetical protein
LQDRLRKLGAEKLAAEALDRIHIRTDWPKLDEKGLDALDEWLTDNPNTRLVLLDTYQRLGSGDSIVDISASNGIPALASITHSGLSNFAVVSYTAAGSRIDLLVNEIGDYSGVVPVSFDQSAAELDVTADGRWQIRVSPLTSAPRFGAPISGSGDAIYLISGDYSRLSITHNGSSNFAVRAYGNSTSLLVNEIGNYSGEIRLPANALVLEIVADGRWSISGR